MMAQKKGAYAGPPALPQVWGSSLVSQDRRAAWRRSGEGKKKEVPSQTELLCGSRGLCEHWLGKAVTSSSFQWQGARGWVEDGPAAGRPICSPSRRRSDSRALQDPRRGWGTGWRASGDRAGSWSRGQELDAGLPDRQLSTRPPVPKAEWKPSLHPRSVRQENRIRRRMCPPRRMMERGRVSGPAALDPNLETGVSRPVKARTPPRALEATLQRRWVLPSRAEPSQRGSSEPKSVGYTNPPPTPGTGTDVCLPLPATPAGTSRLRARDPDRPPVVGHQEAPRVPLCLTQVTWLPGAIRGSGSLLPWAASAPRSDMN